MRGLPIWKNVSSGDIEHKPVLLTDGNRKLLVYASELGEVRAVDPDTGKKIWSYYAPNFSGWKETENRTIFKVRAFFSSTKSFFTAPTLVDLNNDLTLDLVYVGYDDVIYAIDGKRGHLLWKWENKNEVLSMFCNTVLKENKTYIICPSFCYSDSINNRLTSLLRFDTKGKLVERIPILDPSFRNDGLNSLQHNPNEVFFTGQDSLYYYEDNKLKPLLYTGEAFTQKQWDGSNYHTTRNSYGMIFGDRLFSYEKSLNCIVLLSQHDQANPSVGFLEIIDVDQQKILGKFLLPAQSEFPPVITDVNKDGKLDLLVNCMDGYLYCYSLN
jgi:hypothetical protein